jgi:uncharacterized protein (DUF1697 family)
MKHLKEIFHCLGLESVVTDSNSGNVVFTGGYQTSDAYEKKRCLSCSRKFQV